MRRVYAPLTVLLFTACTDADPGEPELAPRCVSQSDAQGTAVTHFHGDAQRSGHLDALGLGETQLSLGVDPRWSSPALDHEEIDGVDYAPLIYATPLYVPGVALDTETLTGTADAVVTATSNGWVYAIAASEDPGCGVEPGQILWSSRLVDPTPIENLDQGVPMGILSTPVIDLGRERLFVAAHDRVAGWQVFGLDLSSGEVLDGWPVTIDDDALQPINTNGPARFHASEAMSQRGALQLSPDGDQVYVAFGTYWGTGVGWLVAVDTLDPGLTAAFSAAAWEEPSSNGGMWGSAGPAVDDTGNVWVTTGNSPPQSGDARGVWGSSLLQLSSGLELERAYSPFNYCQLDAANMDLGASQPQLLQPLAGSSTPNTVAFGGKQGVVYLVDRDAMPFAGDSRGPCTDTAALDRSLLPPQEQPYFGGRGPLSVFGPYSDEHGQIDHAKMRTKLAELRRGDATFLFASGSTKASPSSTDNVAPSIARLAVRTDEDGAAYLQLDAVNEQIVMANPGSPVLSGPSDDAVVWVLDRNAPRTAGLLDPQTPGPVLYGFSAQTMELLFRSDPLGRAGKYASPTIAGNVVVVGTDRLEAFGGPQ